MSTVVHDVTSVRGQCSTETVVRGYHHEEPRLPIPVSLVSFLLSLPTLTFTVKSSILLSINFFPFSVPIFENEEKPLITC